MKTHRALSAVVLALLTINSLFLIANGLFMLADPKKWFLLVPGVKFTGGFNQHFIRDIGIIQIFLGAAFVVGMIRPTVRLELWAAATIWLVAHSLFHFWEVAVGICGPSTILRDFPAVTLPALIGLAASVWAYRNRMLPKIAPDTVNRSLTKTTCCGEATASNGGDRLSHSEM